MSDHMTSDQPYPSAPPPQQPYPTAGGEPPRWAPRYGASFGQALGRFFAKYATFSGRASRSEFWWAYLVVTVVGLALATIPFVYRFATIEYTTVDLSGVEYRVTNPPSPLFWALLVLPAIWWLATIVPSLALGWRRLHDANLPGALWIIAVFVGIAGIVFGLLPSNPQGARYDRPEGTR
ncbi:DUF805 domain-containing protein [Curtobacterium oceanosedimentum]|uniref:DUF805 domain-containing protein n=1 Tax=Curtobacterium oceanosedimentum TaxID=465820 RepID=UPI001B7AAB38